MRQNVRILLSTIYMGRIKSCHVELVIGGVTFTENWRMEEGEILSKNGDIATREIASWALDRLVRSGCNDSELRRRSLRPINNRGSLPCGPLDEVNFFSIWDHLEEIREALVS